MPDEKVMVVTEAADKGDGNFEFLLTSEDEWTKEELARFKGIVIPGVPPPPQP